jgi:cell division transport system permease protein
MGKQNNKMMRRRLANAYMSSVISISLVLLLVGVAGMLLLNARSVSDYFKENMEVSVIMKPGVSEDEALAFQESLDQERFVKATSFVSREQGEQEMMEMLGEDFMDVFEESPIPISIDMTLNADYVSSDSLEVVKNHLLAEDVVDEVNYQQNLVDALNENFSKISAVLAVFIILLLFISYVLINNTVRLSVFARRFTIHTMKLVGATRAFIRAPFLGQAALQGLFSAVIANGALVGLLFVLKNRFGQLFEIFSKEVLIVVMVIVVAAGLLICVISTYFVVNKLVSLEKDELYY